MPGGPGHVPPLVILAALFREVRPFLRRVQARPLGRECWDFSLSGRQGVVCLSGIGEAAAARAARERLASLCPAAIFSVGFAGAVTPQLAPGDVVVGTELWRYERDTAELTQVAAPPAPVAAQELVERLREAGLPAKAGSLVTAPQIVDKEREIEAVQHLLHPALDQETAAVAAQAFSACVPFLGIRAVTDAAGEEIPRFLAEKLDAGVEPGWGQALAWVIADPRRLAILLRLWRRSEAAARNLARALEVVVEVM
jgi:adenosylhomocysteine nucleosidase